MSEELEPRQAGQQAGVVTNGGVYDDKELQLFGPQIYGDFSFVAVTQAQHLA